MNRPVAQPPVTLVPRLAARGLSKRFGGLDAVRGVGLELYPGRLLGVIGPNGAGKSTLVNLLTGHLRPTTGTVVVEGRDVTGARPWHIAHAGVARTFQIVKPFRGMTVLDNVAVAALFGGQRLGIGWRRLPTASLPTASLPTASLPTASLTAARRNALAVLERVGLAGLAGLAPAELSIADARRLELAKALALDPRVLLLDEVLAGLRPVEIDPALELIDSLRREGLALLMVEHVIRAIAAVADEVLVLHQGEVLTTGSAATVLSDSRVIEAYLGHRYAARAAARREPEARPGGGPGEG